MERELRWESKSARLAERQVDALAAHQRVLAVGERRDAVKEQPRRPAPDHDVAMLQPEAAAACRLRFRPPNRKIAGSPSDTETIGAPKSSSSLS